MRMSKADRIYQGFIYFMIGLLLVGSVFPLIYVLGISFASESEWVQRGASMIIPFHPTLQGYSKVMAQSETFLSSLRISVLKTVFGTALSLLVTMCLGYVLSRRGLPGKKYFLVMTLVTILFSGGMIPTFMVVNSTGIYNTFWSLIIPGLIDSWGVLVFKQFFENLPVSVEESACIDGAGEITLMTRIAFPMSKPVIAAMGLFIAVNYWNAWFDALIFITNTKLQPLQLLLRNMFINANLGYDLNRGNNIDVTNRVSDESLKMVITVIGTVPILLVYPFLQKYFISGVYVGSVKG